MAVWRSLHIQPNPMYFLFDTDLAGNFKRLNISFWTGVLCLALVAGKVMLSSNGSEQIGPFGLVLLFGGAALCYYLFLLDHIAFRLKKNGSLWVFGSLVCGPLGFVIGYIRICIAVRAYRGNGLR